VTWVTDDLDCIEIGHHVHIGRFSEIVALARSEHSPVEGRLSIGDRTFIGAQANIRATGGIVRIGRDCLLAQQVSLIGCNHEIRAGQLYCDLTWDTSKTGVTIGNNVTKSIPAGTIWAGNPARQIRVV
jgi:acetyltransferase-like isoleucine patch superfamily enzyme